MKLLLINSTVLFVANPFVQRFEEGGPFMMSLILICFLLALFFMIRSFIALKKSPMTSKKMRALAADASLLGLVIGFFGSIIGMITAFDSIEAFDEINSGLLASGLKVSFLTAVFGTITFIIIRIGILILKGLQTPE